MGKLSVSMNINWDMDMNEYVRVFKDMKVDRIFMAFLDRGPFKSCERRTNNIKTYIEKRKFFEENGFETALWISTLGYGGAVTEYNKEAAKNFVRKKTFGGVSRDDCFCPEDKSFTEVMCEFVKEIAASGTEMLMLDDELCISGVPGLGCTCDLHMKKYCELIGEEITREELPDKIFTGGKNRYRDVWLKMHGDSLREFCASLRRAVDEVNPNMRMGFCAGFTSYDLEGVDAIELTKILAGNTRPFLRFTGAPYWCACNRYEHQLMQTIVEITRQQYEWCKSEDIEVFAEADSYPHNRFEVPCSYVEGFDIATRVSDNMDTLKYVMGYYTQPQYEPSYANEHIAHLGLYDEIAKAFDNKEHIGIRIYEEMRIIENQDLPKKFIGEEPIRNYWMYNQASVIPTAAAIPTTYSGDGICGMAFGEQAKYLPDTAFNKGLIIDIKAAEILQANGIDVGLKSRKSLGYFPVERFEKYGTDIFIQCYTNSYNIEISDKAEVISTYYYEGIETPSAYLYENEKGQRFMVYAFDMEEVHNRSGLILSYCRGRQLNDAIEWLSGEKMPVVCNGQPKLYCICKEDESEISAGYLNFHADEINNAEIKFANKAKSVRFINCEGEATEEGAVIKHIKSFGFAGIVIEK
ncbi:MAG: hypothetical protein U0M60_11160 [Clostridia bacterium]|nr:hypothetical protein [Clostridia bacterium]